MSTVPCVLFIPPHATWNISGADKVCRKQYCLGSFITKVILGV